MEIKTNQTEHNANRPASLVRALHGEGIHNVLQDKSRAAHRVDDTSSYAARIVSMAKIVYRKNCARVAALGLAGSLGRRPLAVECANRSA